MPLIKIRTADNSESFLNEEVGESYHSHKGAIEEALITKGLPYQIVGGIKFYERKEIKDILAYLRFIHNPTDTLSFERIYNIPPRGLGPSAYKKIMAVREKNIFEAVKKTTADETSKS